MIDPPLLGKASPDEVLNVAFRLESVAPIQLNADMIRQLREEFGLRGWSDLTPLEWRAQGSMIQSLTRRNVTQAQWRVITLWYTQPSMPWLRKRVDDDAHAVALMLKLAQSRHSPELVMAVTSMWARHRGSLPQHELRRLQDIAGVSQRQVYRILHGQRDRKRSPGLWETLDGWRLDAVSGLWDTFAGANLIEPRE